jgi:ligand-binding sensor protein
MKLCPDCKTPKGCKTAGKCLKMGGKATSMMGKPSTYYSGGGKVYTGRK